jgi:hypothetical protein
VLSILCPAGNRLESTVRYLGIEVDDALSSAGTQSVVVNISRRQRTLDDATSFRLVWQRYSWAAHSTQQIRQPMQNSVQFAVMERDEFQYELGLSQAVFITQIDGCPARKALTRALAWRRGSVAGLVGN